MIKILNATVFYQNISDFTEVVAKTCGYRACETDGRSKINKKFLRFEGLGQ